ncbi:MAG: hypothetical protein IT438_06545 [Phycisphaerales bacterium]|nr:hypothetical protein [Phycisphaerales bacterium]
MTLPELLIDLGRAGATLRDAYPGLGFAPHAELTLERAAAIAAHKTNLLILLAAGYVASDPPDDAEYILGERLGVADRLGMPTHPGSAAWLVAIGESMGG